MLSIWSLGAGLSKLAAILMVFGLAFRAASAFSRAAIGLAAQTK